MPPQINLTERHQQILWATVTRYIATAEPVGSKALVEEYDFSVSSATVRTIMGHLEKVGLLYQPHVSAGRVPSDGGYRIYVDQLITPDERIGKQVEQTLNQQLKWNSWSFEALLHRAAQILATLSGYIALITMPQTATNQLRHLQLVQGAPGQVILIIVTDTYQTQSILINITWPTSVDESEYEERVEGELQILSNFLNSKLRGRSLAELATLDWGELDREFEQYADLLKTILKELNCHLQPSASTPIMVRGISEVLRQPEFSHLEQVKMLLHLLEEEQEQLWPLIFELSGLESSKRVKVTIGTENPLEPMRACALVSLSLPSGATPVGSVGIIGPTRMLYENTIPLVESAADYLTEAIS